MKQGVPTKLAASKRARIVRERGEFDMRDLLSIMRAPIISSGAYSWSLEQIVAARDAQMAGRFRLPARLAESFATDDALFTARGVRLAPVQSLGVKIDAGRAGRGDKFADEADALFGVGGIAISPETDTTIRQQIVDHGVGFGAISWNARGDGSRWDPVLNAWPIEWVWWHPTANCYVTQVRRLAEECDPTSANLSPSSWGENVLEPIIHGNGRWVVFSKSEILPHRLDATLLAAALVWPCHAFAMRDFRKGSSSHGNAKVVGELPEGTDITDEKGKPTPEALRFLELVMAVASQDAPAGIRPAGSKIDFMTNTSRAWEVWANLAETAERAAARIYLGTDGVLGAQGGAPGVDISELFGVATSKIQSDLACMERSIQSGLIAPWCAVNFGDDKLAPTRRYVFPDPDESRVRADFAARNTAFFADVKAAKDAGFTVDQPLVDRLAELHGVPSPRLSAPPQTLPADGSAPTTDAASVASRGHLVARMPRMLRA